jgi:signal transduction protein with GAF and PtsI domain
MVPALTESTAAIRMLFGAAACSVALVDQVGDHLVYTAASGEGSDAIVGVVLPVGRGIAGWSAMSGQPIAIADVRDDPRFARDVAEATSYVPSSLMAAPLFRPDGEVLGVLSVLDPSVDHPGGWPLAVLGTLAAQMAALVRASTGSEESAEIARLADLGRRVLAATDEYRR